MYFEVNRQDFRETQAVKGSTQALEAGQVRIEIERFALTANNVSYASAGDMLDYWGFFPTTAPWGRIPVMGLGSVVESEHPGVALGGQYFGFYPMANEVVLTVEPRGTSFRDVGAHRSEHAATYTTFSDVSEDASFRAEKADEYLLLRGLFMTSFLIDDFLSDTDFSGASQTLITSASSKTSISLAVCLAKREGHRAIGLTSERNREFVEALGFYDQVVTYDEIGQLDSTVSSTLVDMAGSTSIRADVHNHFGDNLKVSILVGATHWEDTVPTGALAGPVPEFFFAPTQVAKRSSEWGPQVLAERIATSFNELLDGTQEWLSVEEPKGVEALEAVYRTFLEGVSDPRVGYVVNLGS